LLLEGVKLTDDTASLDHNQASSQQNQRLQGRRFVGEGGRSVAQQEKDYVQKFEDARKKETQL